MNINKEDVLDNVRIEDKKLYLQLLSYIRDGVIGSGVLRRIDSESFPEQLKKDILETIILEKHKWRFNGLYLSLNINHRIVFSKLIEGEEMREKKEMFRVPRMCKYLKRSHLEQLCEALNKKGYLVIL